jgi:hypothetical protein
VATIEIFSVSGRKLRTLRPDRYGLVTWDGRDETGQSIVAGVHFVRAVGNDGVVQAGRSMVVLR